MLFVFGSFMFGLQRLFYGPLRPIEVEQLYEKAWFAVTETCLAMTIFREEVGAWFLVMFVALLTGKVWGWIGEGRVEILEQQPPANPTLFHTRLSLSLGLSLFYDMWLMYYTINTVIQQARPNMMVMFLFEFAVLTTSSWSTAIRYALSLIEARIQKQQTTERLAERRREIREEREQILRDRATAIENGTVAADAPPPQVPSEDDVEEMDIEVPGWEAKGHWVLTLDLVTDLIKLGIYTGFFFILLTFYGLPIHIMRDLFLTARSFIKRMNAFWRYRRATRDMNERYQDATAEDIQREDTCIICREEMRPWSVTNPPNPPNGAGAAAPRTSVNERTRPKKLPCGHILHLGCLKSWLERQQVCPTCRRPVMDGTAAANGAAGAAPGVPPNPGHAPQPGAAPRAAAAPPPNGGMRILNFGPLRVGFGQPQDFIRGLNEGARAAQPNLAPNARVYGLELGFPRPNNQAQPAADQPANQNSTQTQLQQLEQQILQQIRDLQASQQELQIVQQLENELARLRTQRSAPATPFANNAPTAPFSPNLQNITNNHAQTLAANFPVSQHGVRQGTAGIPAGSPDLPEGVTIPEGWSLLPLQRVDPPAQPLRPNDPAFAPPEVLPPLPQFPAMPPPHIMEHQARLAEAAYEDARRRVEALRAASGSEPRSSSNPQPAQAPPQPSTQIAEGLARLDGQRVLLNNLPQETRGLAERLLNAETNALRHRASAESLEGGRNPTPPSFSNPQTRRGSGEEVPPNNVPLSSGGVTSAPWGAPSLGPTATTERAASPGLPNWGSGTASTTGSMNAGQSASSPGLPNWGDSGNSGNPMVVQGQNNGPFDSPALTNPHATTPAGGLRGESPAGETPLVATPLVGSADQLTDIAARDDGAGEQEAPRREPEQQQAANENERGESASQETRENRGKCRAATVEDGEDEEDGQ